MEDIGKFLLITGAILSLLGILLLLGGKLPLFGKLPGDIVIEKENFSLYVPITTSIIISILLSILFWLFRR